MGLIAEQMLRPTFRLAIYSGIPLLEIDQNVQNMLDDGDQIRVDFNKGVISNLTQNTTTQVKPVPDFLLDIIQAGGGLGYMQATLANHIVQKNTSTTTKETSHGV